MQGYILGSYENHGGFGKKWATEWQTGMPDLIVGLPHIGGHLTEVKHRPDIDTTKPCPNQLDPIQAKVARDFTNGGYLVLAALVVEGSKTVIGSKLAMFDPIADTWDLPNAVWVMYNVPRGYDVETAIRGCPVYDRYLEKLRGVAR